MSIFDLLGLDVDKIQQLLTRWEIHVDATYLQAVIDIFVFGLVAFLLIIVCLCLLLKNGWKMRTIKSNYWIC